MPGYDRTGPMGAGSRTGGGLGYCSRNANVGGVQGFGAGGGFGHGRRDLSGCRGGYGRMRRPRLGIRIPFVGDGPQWSSDQEHEYYRDRIADLKAELAAMENHIAAMDDNQTDDTEG